MIRTDKDSNKSSIHSQLSFAGKSKESISSNRGSPDKKNFEEDDLRVLAAYTNSNMMTDKKIGKMVEKASTQNQKQKLKN